MFETLFRDSSETAEHVQDAVDALALELAIEARDLSHRTPLSYAAERGHCRIIRLLLDTAQVEVSPSHRQPGRSPLAWAAASGHTAVVALLLDKGADVEGMDYSYGRTALSFSAENGHEAVVSTLLDKGSAIADAKAQGESVKNRTPLSYAAGSGHAHIVAGLLRQPHVDLNAVDGSERTLFWWAATNGHDAVVQMFLDHVRFQSSCIDGRDEWRRAPLSKAAEMGHLVTVQKLLDTGKADVVSRSFGDRTPLSWAAESGQAEVVQLLLRDGRADANDKTYSGRTPLSWAVDHGHEGAMGGLAPGRSCQARHPRSSQIALVGCHNGSLGRSQVAARHEACGCAAQLEAPSPSGKEGKRGDIRGVSELGPSRSAESGAHREAASGSWAQQQWAD